MNKLIKVLKYVGPYKGYALLNVTFNILSILFSLFSLTMLIPFLDLVFLSSNEDHVQNMAGGIPNFELSTEALRQFFSYYFSSFIMQNPEDGKMNALILICILIVLMVFLKNLFRYLALFVMAELRNGVLTDIRQQIYERLIILPKSYFTDEKKGDIMSRISTDVKEVEWTILRSVEMLFRDPMSLIVFLAAMLIMSAKLTLFVLLMLPITTFIIGKVGKSLKKTSKKGQEKIGDIMALVEETLSGLTIIKAFNAQNKSIEKFKEENSKYKSLMIKIYRKSDLSAPLSEFLGVLILVVVIWFGGKLVLDEDGLSASVFIAYIAIFSQIIPPAKSFTTAYYNLQKGAASVDRINEILRADEKITNHPNAIEKLGFEHKITFDNVGFAYGEIPVINNVQFEVLKGSKVALVGASGSGKTTLAHLLPRFYDVQSGSIQIDGIDIRKLRIKSLRALIGFVSQDAILFNDSIANNIAFGQSEYDIQEVIEAAKIANAHTFIESFENGYDTIVGDGGGKLSGGQRQRISIARAIFKNPPILVLDEATSALDSESEKLVQEALNKLMSNRTSLVIAHHLNTIKNADTIVVLNQGKVEEIGNHEALLKRPSGIYKKLFELQTFNA